MQEPSATPQKVASPPKGIARVEDGKIKKLKASYKSETPAIQHFNGKTYASAIDRDATSTPKPVWEDADGNKMTLKKVWADANGKEINDEEYQDRKKRMKEREEAKSDEVKSSCCGSGKPNAELDSLKGGCRHRQNVAAIQPHPGFLKPGPDPAQRLQPKPASETWKASCSCGSGCSCLYCPDHPNNATSINHTQQQVKNLAEQAYIGNQNLTQVPSMPQNNPRSCMGGQPSFFLSRTPDVSQQQLQQFFSDTLNPNAIYLTYPIQQHSWTNRPLSSHCSHVHSPPEMIGMSQTDMYDPLADTPTPWDLLPSESNGTWNFSDGQLGDNSFSWTDVGASYGTDYAIGQARVASMSNAHDISAFQPQPAPRTRSMNIDVSSITSPSLLNGFPDALPLFDSGDGFMSFEETATQNPSSQNIQANVFGSGTHPEFPASSLPGFSVSRTPDLHSAEPAAQVNAQGSHVDDGGSILWNGYDNYQDSRNDSELNGIPVPNSSAIASNAV
ncbi:uncharacterized protein Z519_06900 [Cladophialophora bantiana CBS 173.52]|uniref:Copper-fist domain-containing protein n=1 Tax=Cladophialophora bantiana (strain ATCC 10958 / CBS 173.52 / CDC B-1940 / NIH 8579) TaxID=1442370 RepID=A0A0D2ET50_CLAB1|nr:uncharacterized protein Z519_06900 [Cladophialophora bantiana CBS 173.52]KIW93051.1 hypothetical protein Z519_06900 [Cladophialophora bantiana CBS 173.52]